MEIQVAVAQIDVERGNAGVNASAIGALLSDRRAAGDDLVIFPECALTGYIFESADAARAASIPETSEHIEVLRRTCEKLGVYAQVGFLERDGDDLFNSALLMGPSTLAKYRKQHIPPLGADKFVTCGEPSPVIVDTPIGRLGMLICFDLRFPEHARTLALAGADILTMSTNWPDEVTVPGDLLTRARAAENRTFLAVANRADSEGGVSFRGRSQIVDPDGNVLAMAPPGAGVVSTRIDVSDARNKHELFRMRRPEAYSSLSEVSIRNV